MKKASAMRDSRPRMPEVTTSPVCVGERRCLPGNGVALGETVTIVGAITVVASVVAVVAVVFSVVGAGRGMSEMTADVLVNVRTAVASVVPICVKSGGLTMDGSGNGKGAKRVVEVHFVVMTNFIVRDCPGAVESGTTVGVSRASTPTTHPDGVGYCTAEPWIDCMEAVPKVGRRAGLSGTSDCAEATAGPAAVVDSVGVEIVSGSCVREEGLVGSAFGASMPCDVLTEDSGVRDPVLIVSPPFAELLASFAIRSEM